MSFLSQLNPQQREAVETTDGPVLILAGAGSGKTRVITYRIAHLIESIGAMPESILAMTFTNKAAAEMGERVEKLVGGLSIAKPVISTFHSFCVRLLRRDIEAMRIPSSVPGKPPIGHSKSFVIYDESDQQQITKSIMRRLGIDDKQLTPRAAHQFAAASTRAGHKARLTSHRPCSDSRKPRIGISHANSSAAPPRIVAFQGRSASAGDARRRPMWVAKPAVPRLA